MSLQMRAGSERCGTILTQGGTALICSYECTLCESCASRMDHVCANCGGELVRRPRRGEERS